MNVNDACELIDDITYKPGWTFTAGSYPLYEDTVELTVRFDAPNTDVAYAPAYPIVFPQSATFYLHVGACRTQFQVWNMVLECVLHLELHELREFFAVDDAYRKPFHAHTMEGIRNWATRPALTTQGDLADVTIVIPVITREAVDV